MKILDCTLRDGGYYNNWEFNRELINEYLKVMNNLEIDFVEIGFRFLDNVRTKGPTAYSDESFLKSLKIPKNLKIGIMINAADFVNNENIISLAKKKFLPKKKSIISLIRIACHQHEIESVIPLINWLKKSGYKVGVNIMQIPELTNKEIKKSVLKIRKTKVDVLYFADSLGSLNSKTTQQIIKKIRLYWKGSIGIHAHDNMGKALENSITAIKNSVDWIDCTVTGMGRGPGNTKTEYMILEFKRKKEHLLNLLNLINDYFKPLKDKYNWGSNPFYYYAGMNSIHPTFVQEMMGGGFDSEDIYSNLNYLSTIGGKKFSNELISLGKNYYKIIRKGSWSPEKMLKKKDVLIIGPGLSVYKYKKKILNFIKKKRPIVLVLNAISPIPKKYINAHVVCHILRLLSDIEKYKKLDKNIITPYSSFSKNIKSKINSNKILDFGLQVKNKKFNFEKKHVVLPNSLAISYALGICTSGLCNKIFLAGLDGYTPNSPKKYEMDELFQNYKLEKFSRKIYSLTPTSYKINFIKKM